MSTPESDAERLVAIRASVDNPCIGNFHKETMRFVVGLLDERDAEIAVGAETIRQEKVEVDRLNTEIARARTPSGAVLEQAVDFLWPLYTDTDDAVPKMVFAAKDDKCLALAALITAAVLDATERAYATLDHRLKTFIAGAQFNKETIGAQTADELLAALSLVLTEYRADRVAPEAKP